MVKVGASYFVSIYSNVNGYPGTRLYKSDLFDQGTAAVKINTATFSFVAGTKYWTGFSVDRQSGIRGIQGIALLQIGVTSSTNYNSFTIATASSSLPVNISPSSLTLFNSTNVPAVNWLVV